MRSGFAIAKARSFSSNVRKATQISKCCERDQAGEPWRSFLCNTRALVFLYCC